MISDPIQCADCGTTGFPNGELFANPEGGSLCQPCANKRGIFCFPADTVGYVVRPRDVESEPRYTMLPEVEGVLRELARAWRSDMDSDHYNAGACGYRTAEWLCQHGAGIEVLQKLERIGVAESKGDEYRLTSNGVEFMRLLYLLTGNP